jgi:hypothetical protein
MITPMIADVRVIGSATPEDVAAILAALRLREAPLDPPRARYEQWRRQRLAVLRDNR